MKGVWQRTIVDNNGNVQAFASVEFRDEADNTLADIFSDKEGTASPGNPKTADAFGFLRVYLEPGVGHKITATKGIFSAEWRDEQVNPGLATSILDSDGAFITGDAGLISGADKAALDNGLSVPDGDKGDITVSGLGATWTVDNNVITDAKLRDSAGVSVLGRAANSNGDPADIVASVNDRVLVRVGDVLSFAQLTNGMIPVGIALNSPDIEGGTIDDAVIGSVTPDLITGTTITAFDTSPSFRWYESDASATERAWEAIASAEIFNIQTRGDAFTGGQVFISATRSGTSVAQFILGTTGSVASLRGSSITLTSTGNTVLDVGGSLTLGTAADTSTVSIFGSALEIGQVGSQFQTVNAFASTSITMDSPAVIFDATNVDIVATTSIELDAPSVTINDSPVLTSASTINGRYIQTQILTSGTSFTTSATTNKIRYRMVGGGAGGGGAATAAVSCAAASGGGSGSYSEGWFAVAPSTSYSYAIGALGAGGAAGANNGSNGGSTTLTVGATTVTCFGGTGGLAMAIDVFPSGRRGGLRGATSTNGDFNTPGNCGELSIRFSGTEGISGAGGVSALGSGAGQNLEVGAAGSSATANNTGAGGGGALVENGSAAVAGGNGSPGLIIINEYT